MPRPVIRIAHDPEANLRYVHTGDVEGLNAEAPNADALTARIPITIADLRDEDEPVPVQIVIVQAEFAEGAAGFATKICDKTRSQADEALACQRKSA